MKTILVADDYDWQVRELIEKLKTRYTVEYVSDGRQAIERIAKGGLDGAVLDWEMPPSGMKEDEARRFYGDNVAREARRLQPNLVLVLRSTIAGRFAETLKPHDVFCHIKRYGPDDDKPVLDYLQSRLGE